MQTDDPMDYRIADLRIRIPGECLPGPLHPAFSPFAEPESGTPELLLHMVQNVGEIPAGRCLDRFPCIDATTECLFIRWSGGVQVELHGPEGNSARFRLQEQGCKACTDCRPDRQPSLLRFGLWLLCNAAALDHGAVSLHAAAVCHHGQGVLFLGESGTGKSTHARLWCRHIPATDLLNDDSPFIRLLPAGTPQVYGSPWSGKSPCYRPLRLPIAAIIRLEQGPRNIIRPLRPLEAAGALLPSAPPSFAHDERLLATLCRIFSQLIAQVPVYHFTCRPDAAAAHLAYLTVFGNRPDR